MSRPLAGQVNVAHHGDYMAPRPREHRIRPQVHPLAFGRSKNAEGPPNPTSKVLGGSTGRAEVVKHECVDDVLYCRVAEE